MKIMIVKTILPKKEQTDKAPENEIDYIQAQITPKKVARSVSINECSGK